MIIFLVYLLVASTMFVIVVVWPPWLAWNELMPAHEMARRKWRQHDSWRDTWPVLVQ